MAKPTSPTLEQFLSGLRTAWKDGGEVRPTSVAKAKPKRLRRRPDPFAAVTTELRAWFEVSVAVAAQAVRLDRRRDALCSLLARAAGAASFDRLPTGPGGAMGIANGAGGGDGLGDL